MRMRHKKNLAPRWESASAYHIPAPEDFRGRWQSALMPDAQGVWLELGCGKGGFACELAHREPQRLILGAERVRDALIAGMENAQAHSLGNLCFIAGDAEHLGNWFAPEELSGIYVHFCDPWPSRKHAHRRLVAGNFLDIYRPLLASGAALRFKTDNAPLFDFALEELRRKSWTLVEVERNLPRSEKNIETAYERKFRDMGISICALTATVPG